MMYVEGSFNERNGHPSFECDSVEITLANGRRFRIEENGMGGLRSVFVDGSPHNTDRAEARIEETRKIDEDNWPNSIVHDGIAILWRVIGTKDDPVVEWKTGQHTGAIEWTMAQDLVGLSIHEAIVQRVIEAHR